MYERHFKFHSRPFPPVPQTSTYYPATAIENARRILARAIERGEGPGVVLGPAGTGKTLLVQMLAEQFGDYAVALLTSGRQTTCQALLQAICYELGLPYRGLDEGELRLAIIDHLEPRDDGPSALVLLVDEAHTLSSKLLEELRLLTNLVRDGQPRVRLVLAGHPSLEEHLAHPRLSSFSQRITARAYLEPLNRHETAEYVRAQLAHAGGEAGRLVDDEAIDFIFRTSDGVPRLINQVCDHALVLTAIGNEKRLTAAAVDEAWADLQQLPTRMHPAARAADASSVIVEFGRLDDEDKIDLPAPVHLATEAVDESLPALSIASDDAEDQIDTITAHLSSLDQGEPVASLGTEVELDFPEFADPFGEHFVEEEVVLDRYRSDVEMFADVPRVSSWEGQQLGSLLPAGDEAWSPERALRITAAASESIEGEQPPDELAAAAWSFEPASDPVLPEEDEPAAIEFGRDVQTALSAGAQSTVRPIPLDSLFAATGSPTAIIIEDDPLPRSIVTHVIAAGVSEPPIATPVHVPPAGVSARPARRGELRNLFSKLRRG